MHEKGHCFFTVSLSRPFRAADPRKGGENMAEPGALEYFYGTEAEQYTFTGFRRCCSPTPVSNRQLATRKSLYGFDVDRMGLSIRNGWLDEQNRVFIYFTLEEAMGAMGCGHNKAVALLPNWTRWV